MPIIKFTTNLPLTGTSVSPKPWVFDPKIHFNGVPNKPGVYIVGVKIPVNGQGEKFCPLYVGIREKLRDRLIEHRGKLKKGSGIFIGYLNGKKELFDLKRQPADFYNDIEIMEKYLLRGPNSKTEQDFFKPFVFNIIADKRFGGRNTLIWYPDRRFFNQKLKVTTSKYPIDKLGYATIGKGHIESLEYPMGDLFLIKTDKSLQLIKTINKTKDTIYNKFWFAYSILEKKDYKTVATKIEFNTKSKLKGIGIHTYGDAKDKLLPDFDIDLSAIQSDLVNMTGKPFVLNKKGEFII